MRIADLGAGTGLVGQRLKEEYGFTKITAFDLSKCMLYEVKKKCAYSDFVTCDLNEEDMAQYYGQFDNAIQWYSIVKLAIILWYCIFCSKFLRQTIIVYHANR